jgi:hypothetical protein
MTTLTLSFASGQATYGALARSVPPAERSATKKGGDRRRDDLLCWLAVRPIDLPTSVIVLEPGRVRIGSMHSDPPVEPT